MAAFKNQQQPHKFSMKTAKDQCNSRVQHRGNGRDHTDTGCAL